jgi:hypothetical protein
MARAFRDFEFTANASEALHSIIDDDPLRIKLCKLKTLNGNPRKRRVDLECRSLVRQVKLRNLCVHFGPATGQWSVSAAEGGARSAAHAPVEGVQARARAVMLAPLRAPMLS